MTISCGPIGFLLGLIGLILDRNKKPAIVALIIFLATAGFVFLR